MTERRPKVLVVDDDEDILLALHRVLFQDNERYDVLLASTAQTAQAILGELQVDVLLTDFLLPDRSGMDLLSWAALSCPHTHVIVMTAFDVSGIRDRAHAFGCLRVVQKPLDFHEMRAAVLSALDQPDGLGGKLSELSPLDIVQMLCLGRKTTAVRFSEGVGSGVVYVVHGEPVHAVWDDLVGEEAFHRMMAVENGAFHTAPLPADIARTLPRPWQYLVMESTRRLDEARRRAAASKLPPPPPPAPTCPPPQPSATRPRSITLRSAQVGPAEVATLIDEGFAQLRAGRRDGARAAWEQALRLDPKNQLVELNLRKLNRPSLFGAPAAARR